jgi:hypothetical protein
MRRAAQSALTSAVRLIVLITAVAAARCGPPAVRVTLPTGAGVPYPDYASAFAQATASCRAIRSLTADLALSGSVGRQRLRGHVLSGFAADGVRLEGVAPFGGPAFILAAQNGRGTLLLPRDRRVLQSAPPAEILEALVGVKLSPADLRGVLTGCVKAAPAPVAGKVYGSEWLAVDLNGATAYLRRNQGEWSLASAVLEGLQVDYGSRLRGLPQQVRIRTADPRQTPRVDVQVGIQSPEVNPDIDPAAFSVAVPAGTSPITLQELRESYHR